MLEKFYPFYLITYLIVTIKSEDLETSHNNSIFTEILFHLKGLRSEGKINWKTKLRCAVNYKLDLFLGILQIIEKE